MPDDPGPEYAPVALPSRAVRIGAFVAIIVAGFAGGVLGWAFADLQTDSENLAGAIGVGTAVVAAVGVGTVVVLAMRASAEWRR